MKGTQLLVSEAPEELPVWSLLSRHPGSNPDSDGVPAPVKQDRKGAPFGGPLFGLRELCLAHAQDGFGIRIRS